MKYIKEELWECRVVGIMDADGQHLPDDMEKLLMKAAAEPMALIVGRAGLLTGMFPGNPEWEI